MGCPQRSPVALLMMADQAKMPKRGCVGAELAPSVPLGRYFRMHMVG